MVRLSTAQALIAALSADEMYFGEDTDEAWIGDQLVWKKGKRHVLPLGTMDALTDGTSTEQHLWSPAVINDYIGTPASVRISTSFRLQRSDIMAGRRFQIIAGTFDTDSTDTDPIYVWIGSGVDLSSLQLTGLQSYQRNGLLMTPYTGSGRRYYRLHDVNIQPGGVFTLMSYSTDGTNELYLTRYSGTVGESSKLVFDNAFNYGTYQTRHNLVGDFIWIIPELYTTDSSSTNTIYVNAIPTAFTADIIGWDLTDQRYDISTTGVATTNVQGQYRVAHNIELLAGTVLLCRETGRLLTAEIIGLLDVPQPDWNADPALSHAGILNKPPNSTGIADFMGTEGEVLRIWRGVDIVAAINANAAVADWNAVNPSPARILNKPATMGDVPTASSPLTSITNYRVILRPPIAGVPLPGPRQRVEESQWFRVSDLVALIQAAPGTNIKPDWNAAAGTNAEILNKPTIPTGISDVSQSNRRH